MTLEVACRSKLSDSRWKVHAGPVLIGKPWLSLKFEKVERNKVVLLSQVALDRGSGESLSLFVSSKRSLL